MAMPDGAVNPERDTDRGLYPALDPAGAMGRQSARGFAAMGGPTRRGTSQYEQLRARSGLGSVLVLVVL